MKIHVATKYVMLCYYNSLIINSVEKVGYSAPIFKYQKYQSLKKGNHIVICLLLKFNCIVNKLNKSNKFIVITKAIIIDICLPKGKVMQTEKTLIAYVFDMGPEDFVFQLFIILLIHHWFFFFLISLLFNTFYSFLFVNNFFYDSIIA